MKTKLYHHNSISTFPKLIDLNLQKYDNKQIDCKKIFSRKPNKNVNNSSRFVSNRLKLQENQNFDHECKQKLEKSKVSKTKQKDYVRFLSSKNSQSLQKILMNSSLTNLSTPSSVDPSKTCTSFKNENYFSNNNSDLNCKQSSGKYCNSLILRLNKNSSHSSLINQKDQSLFDSGKYNSLSTQLSSNENICVSQFTDIASFQSKKMTTINSAFLNSQNKSNHKHCQKCQLQEKQLRELINQNLKLQGNIKEKQSEIKMLKSKISSIQKNFQKVQNQKLFLDSEIKQIKENEKMLEYQKEEIEKINSKLEQSLRKISQELRYKELEVNISKIYKTKSLEMEFKVEMLKKELERTKKYGNKLNSSVSTGNLHGQFLKRDYSTISLRGPKGLVNVETKKPQKMPKITKVYQEDSLFSLTSQSTD